MWCPPPPLVVRLSLLQGRREETQGRVGVRGRRALPTQTPSSPDSETGEDDISDVQGTQRLELRDDGDFSTPTGELSRLLQEQAGGLPPEGAWASPCSFP